ncbi:MAG: glycoside hydrolase family 3 C-terminal domain-containing protein [Bacteroidales bacterium]|nr:glycoside hydrolase family 3 C-terminal domain-containing protein [Bacteroidales bacterium]
MVSLLSCGGRVDYKDSKAPIDKRVDDLISRMTLEEKVEQLQSQLLFLPEYAERRNFKMGNVRNIAHFMHVEKPGLVPASACAEAINEDTRKSIEANRWQIPVLQHGEALHGAQWGNASCFPQSISIAASFDDELYARIGEAVARELRAVGVRQVLAPVVNISRDPRWGRTQEGYGEDVLLNSRMGATYTKALEQGGIIATPKHYVDNYGDGGHDSYASSTSWRVLREVFLEPFRACVEEGGARSIMAAYNTIDGIPCSASEVLLNDILRNEWNFKGFVVSDYNGVYGVNNDHHLTKDHAESQALSIKAGMDVEFFGGQYFLQAVKDGKLTEEIIDRSLRRLLTCKFELGLFDEPYVDAAKADEIVRCQAHRDLALEAGRKVMTLLKNDNNTLPLQENKLKRIGLFGPAADVLSLGDYSGPVGDGWSGDGVTPCQGLKKRLQGKADVVLHTTGTNPIALARTCDAVIFFGAIHEGEGGDRSHLTLPAHKMAIDNHDKSKVVDADKNLTIEIDQEKMIHDLAATGVKTIVVLQNGALVDIHNWMDDADAILEAWYAGEQGGTAIAEVLLGDVNPGGRLPISWMRHVGQVPYHYSIKPSGRGYGYNDDDGRPIYPFGYGLSYTTFEYSDLSIPANIGKDETATVRVTVKNTGNRAGDEVVQLYMRPTQTSVVVPMKQLKAFKRVTLNPGESKQVELSLPYRSFGIWNKDLKFVVESGIFNLWIGKDADNVLLEGKTEIQ